LPDLEIEFHEGRVHVPATKEMMIPLAGSGIEKAVILSLLIASSAAGGVTVFLGVVSLPSVLFDLL